MDPLTRRQPSTSGETSRKPPVLVMRWCCWKWTPLVVWIQSMREIVKKILSSQVPFVVYVAPSGSRAASAGAIIALAADYCAMAPGTAIGAAHPVSIGGKPDKVMQEKVVNDLLAYVEGIAKQRNRNS